MDLFRHFSEENHHGFLENFCLKIIDRLVGGGGRIRETFWQYKIDIFTLRDLNVRLVEANSYDILDFLVCMARAFLFFSYYSVLLWLFLLEITFTYLFICYIFSVLRFSTFYAFPCAFIFNFLSHAAIVILLLLFLLSRP